MKNTTIFNTLKKNTITIIGELLIDEITHNDKDEFEIVVGGSPLNIAINLHDLGLRDVRLFGCVGKDSYGTKILDKLLESGIDISHIQIRDESTSVAEVNISTSTPVASFRRSADKFIDFTEELQQAIIDSSIVHFSYWPISDYPSQNTILKVINLAKKHNTLVGFDPNFHKDLVTANSPNISLLKDIIKSANIMKPSKDDSERLFNQSLSNREFLRLYNEIGCDLTVLSIGKEGVIASYNHEIIEIPTHAKEVIDVTGAGDAFYAGLYMSIINGYSFQKSLEIGSKCSAYNIKKVGGFSDLPEILTLVGERN